MRWMVIYEYGVPGGALNLNSTNYPDHGRAGNRTRDLMISSQKLLPPDHEAGLLAIVYQYRFIHFTDH
jgi:hypothetical protein